METSDARFSVGEVVRHRLFGYRGVVVDVDPVFELTDEWYEQVARSRPPRDAPWYHVVAEGSDAMRYVAERNLESDPSGQPVDSPLVDQFFTAFDAGRYTRPAH